MKKILYIVSTLQNSGPTNQLYNIISHLDLSRFKPYVLTLSKEPLDGSSRWANYEKLGIKLHSLELSRAKGLIFGKKAVMNFISAIKPDLIHTQGIRADAIISSLKPNIPWVMTSRNFPPEDYPSKFGRIKGSLMAKKHLDAIRSCEHLVCCSKTILDKLNHVGANGVAIQNGVAVTETEDYQMSVLQELPKPIFISVGSLIPRKNMELLIEAFSEADEERRGSLVILGDGPLRNTLTEKSPKNVHILGSVDNVGDYLRGADYFVSTSLSEGLPNTVLEALSAGLPSILSDIEPHKEIERECGRACHIVPLNGGSEEFCKAIEDASDVFKGFSSDECRINVNAKFSASEMSARYQRFYNDVLEAK